MKQPPDELHRAAFLVKGAADALMNGNLAAAEELILQADIPEIYEHLQCLWGRTDPEIHMYREILDAPPRVREIKERMPAKAQKKMIYERDGWHCRFCASRVIVPEALEILRKSLASVRWGSRDIDKNSAFLALKAVVDHVLPHSRGGDNSLSNLVTTCRPCNYARSYWTLDEVGLSDPRGRPPLPHP